MKKRNADRTVRIGKTCFVGIIVLLNAAILLAIFTNIYFIIPIIFAVYTIANAGFCSVIINKQGKRWSRVLLEFAIGFITFELLFIILYILVLFIESII